MEENEAIVVGSPNDWVLKLGLRLIESAVKDEDWGWFESDWCIEFCDLYKINRKMILRRAKEKLCGGRVE